MPKASVGSMSVDALLKLRDDIGKVLSSKVTELRGQLARLEGETGYGKRGRPTSLKGRKVAVKYRDGSGNAWAGRGAQPVWLRESSRVGSQAGAMGALKNLLDGVLGATKTRARVCVGTGRAVCNAYSRRLQFED
jgi:H-NS histone family